MKYMNFSTVNDSLYHCHITLYSLMLLCGDERNKFQWPDCYHFPNNSQIPKFLNISGPPNVLEGFHLNGKCTNFTAILRWHSLPIYNNSNIVVVIEWRTTYDDAGRWYKVSEKVNATVGQARVANLSPWSKVQFRAITQNSYGDGPVCEPTKFESCETSPTRK